MVDLNNEEKDFLLNILYLSKNGWEKALKTIPKRQEPEFKKAILMCETISFKLKEGEEDA